MPKYTIHPGDMMIQFTAREDRVIRSGNFSVTPGVTDGVTDGERCLLQLLSINPGMSYVALAAELGISKKTVAERMASLKSKGVIERIGTNKKGYWKINR